MHEQQMVYNIKDLCAVLGGISRDTVYDLFNSGDLPKLKIGARTVVAVDDVKAYIAKLKSDSIAVESDDQPTPA